MKTLTPFLFILTILCSNIAPAQTFQTITGSRFNSEYGTCAATDADSNLLVAGYLVEVKTVLSSDYSPFLIQFTPNGSVDSRLTIPELRNDYGATPVGMEALHNAAGEANGYIIVFDYRFDIVVARFNNYGKVVWAKTIRSVEPSFGKVVQAAYIPGTKKLNGFYLTLSHSYFDKLVKLSGDGDILWQKQINYPPNGDAFFISDIVADDDGGCVITGNLTSGDSKPVLMKFSPYGRLLWGKRYDFYNSVYGARVSAIAATNDGYVLTGGESTFNLTFKTNKSGNILWANNYSTPSPTFTNRIIIDGSGNILLPGSDFYRDVDTARNVFIVKLDSTGNIIFGKRYHSNNTVLNDIQLAPGGYYAAGNTDFGFSSQRKTDLYVLKTNTSGKIGGSCATSVLDFTKTPTQYKNTSTPEYSITDDTLTAYNIVLTTEKYLGSFPQNRCGSSIAALSKSEENQSASLNNISLAPNPSRGMVTVTYTATAASNIQLNVFDKTGRVRFTKKENAVKGKNMYQFNLSNLINGLYNLQLINGSEQNQVKVVIEK